MTGRPSPTTCAPRPCEPRSPRRGRSRSAVHALTYNRDARTGGGFSAGFGGTDIVTINPTPAVTIGSQSLQSTLSGAGGKGATAYTYDLAFNHSSVGQDAGRPRDRHEHQHGDRRLLRRPARPRRHLRPGRDQWRVGAFFSELLLTLGVERTEYVGGSAGVQWVEEGSGQRRLHRRPRPDGRRALRLPRRHDRPRTAGSSRRSAPASRRRPRSSASAFCYGCQSAQAISVGMAPFTDSMPDHVGSLFANPNGQPVAHFTLTRNGQTIADADDAFGATVSVPAGQATYHAVIDIDRSPGPDPDLARHPHRAGLHLDHRPGPGRAAAAGSAARRAPARRRARCSRSCRPGSRSGCRLDDTRTHRERAGRRPGGAGPPARRPRRRPRRRCSYRVAGSSAWTSAALRNGRRTTSSAGSSRSRPVGTAGPSTCG